MADNKQGLPTLPELPKFPSQFTEQDAARLEDLGKLATAQKDIYMSRFTPEVWGETPYPERAARGVAALLYNPPQWFRNVTPWTEYGLTPEQADVYIRETEAEIKELERVKQVSERAPTIKDYITSLALQGLLSGEEAELYELIPELNPRSQSIDKLPLTDEERQWFVDYSAAIAGKSPEEIANLYTGGFPVPEDIEEWMRSINIYPASQISPTQILSAVAFSKDIEELGEYLTLAYPPQVENPEQAFQDVINENVKAELEEVGITPSGNLVEDMKAAQQAQLQKIADTGIPDTITVGIPGVNEQVITIQRKDDGIYFGGEKIANIDPEGKAVPLSLAEEYELQGSPSDWKTTLLTSYPNLSDEALDAFVYARLTDIGIEKWYRDYIDPDVQKNSISLGMMQDFARGSLPGYARAVLPGRTEQAFNNAWAAGEGSIIGNVGSAALWLGADGGIAQALQSFGRETRWMFMPNVSSMEDFHWYNMLNPVYWVTPSGTQAWLNLTSSLPFTLLLLPLALLGYYAGAAVALPVAGKVGLGVFGTTILQSVFGGALGSAFSRPVESVMEAANTFDAMTENNASFEEAREASDNVFWNNMKLAGLDAVQIGVALAPIPPPAKWAGSGIANGLFTVGRVGTKVFIEALTQGGEEYYQTGIQRQAMGTPDPWAWDSEAQQAATIGGIMGVGFGVGGDVLSNIIHDTETYMTPEQRDVYDTLKAESIEELEAKGVDKAQAELTAAKRALDDYASTPDGAELIADLTEVAKEDAYNAEITDPAKRVHTKRVDFLQTQLEKFDSAIRDYQQAYDAAVDEMETTTSPWNKASIQDRLVDLKEKIQTTQKIRDNIVKELGKLQPFRDFEAGIPMPDYVRFGQLETAKALLVESVGGEENITPNHLYTLGSTADVVYLARTDSHGEIAFAASFHMREGQLTLDLLVAKETEGLGLSRAGVDLLKYIEENNIAFPPESEMSPDALRIYRKYIGEVEEAPALQVGDTIPAAERGRLAGSLEKQAKGLLNIAADIIDEIGEINKKQNKTEADLGRKAKLGAKLQELQAKASELYQAASDINSGIVTPLVAKFFPDLVEVTPLAPATEEIYSEGGVPVDPDEPIPSDVSDESPIIQDIGIVERVRPARKVFEKLGLYKLYKAVQEAEVNMLEARIAFRQELLEVSKLVKKDRRYLVFRELENPGREVAPKETPTVGLQAFTDLHDRFYALIDKYLGKKAHVEYTAAIIGGEKSFLTIAGMMDSNPTYKASIRQALRDIGMSEEFIVYRGMKSDFVAGKYMNVTIDAKVAEEFGEVTRFKARINDVIGIGKANEGELLFRTESLIPSVPTVTQELTTEEQQAVDFFKRHFDEWANKLNIPEEQRRANYITHIFETDMAAELKAKHPLDPAILRILEYRAPKTIFNPYLQERLGKTTGLIEDPFAAAWAYDSRAMRVLYYEPLLQKIAAIANSKDTPPIARRYLREYIRRMTGAPSKIDIEVNNTLRGMAAKLEKLPGGEHLANLLSHGNPAGMASYNLANIYYTLWMGLKPSSAIRNLSQHLLTLCEVGTSNFAKGIALRATAEGKAALSQSLAVRSRKGAYLPGIDEAFGARWTQEFREIALSMFRFADRQNVSDAFLAGYAEAKSLFPDAPQSLWIERGDEVAADTQYLYTQMNAMEMGQSSMGRVLTVLTTWGENFVELGVKWIKRSPSQVYSNYAKEKGISLSEVMPKKNWSMTYKSALLYLAIVSLAFSLRDRKRLEAWQYTGITSLNYLADAISGELPGLEIPGAVANLVSGFLTQDDRRFNEAWNALKRTFTPGVATQLLRIANGERDWLTAFFYLQDPDEIFQTTKVVAKFMDEKREQLGQSIDGKYYTLSSYRTDLMNKIDEEGIPVWQVDADRSGFSNLDRFAYQCESLLSEYKNLPSGDRADYRITHPAVDAALFFWEQVSTIRSKNAKEILEQYFRSFDFLDEQGNIVRRVHWTSLPDIPDWAKLLPE